MADDRKSFSVWLKPRHQRMLAEMPDISLGDVTRKSIEDLFEGRNEREYAQLCINEDLAELKALWERLLGLKTSFTVTATEDGFRIVLVSTKKYGTDPEPEVETPRPTRQIEDLGHIEFDDELED